MRRTLAVAAVLVVALSGCGRETAQPEAISVRAVDYDFEAPASVAAGLVRLELVNNGEDVHHLQVLRLNDGVDVDQLVVGSQQDPSGGFLADLTLPAGGPGAVDPGGTQAGVLTLEEGRYAFVCFVHDAEGRAHLGLGMAQEFEVTAGAPASLPEADQTVVGRDFSFELPDSWTGTLRFDNSGAQPHEFQVIGVAEGATPEDVLAFFQGEGPAGPPPITSDGGTAALAPGRSQVFELDLVPGTYFAVCFILDPQSQAPHFALGMIERFEVE